MTSTAPLRLAVIVGSTREGRFGPVVAGWIARLAGERADLEVDLVDLVEAELPATLGGMSGPEPDAVTALAPRLADADAFAVVTPEYNHSYPASLKTVIDWYLDEWKAKPVGFVSYGGLGGGLRAVEHLRPVFAEVHAMSVRDTVSFHGCWDAFDEHGETDDDAAAHGAAKGMLDQLVWWGRALREARARVPYGR